MAASLLFFVGCIWSSVAVGYGSLLASRVVTAFAGGSTEALGAAIINVSSKSGMCTMSEHWLTCKGLVLPP